LVDPDRGHDPLAVQHWVVAATKPARGLVATVDQSVAYPRAEFEAEPKEFTVRGVDATLVTGDVAGSGLAGSGHAIVYWQFDGKARIAEQIARGLIVQMVECAPRRSDTDAEFCEWVFGGTQ
jgi:hypothetical protein